MLKIYNPGPEICDDLQGCYYKNFLAFDIEYDKFIHTKDIHDADVIAIHGHNLFGQGQIYKKVEEIKQLKLREDQKLLLMHIFHLDHTFPDKRNFLFVRKIFEQELENEFAFVHTNFALDDEIQYDFLFNRQKIYFTNYNLIDLQERLYVNGCDIKNFELASLKKAPEIIGLGKRFLCPNRIYSEFDHPRFKYRRLMQDYIRRHPNEGFFSDFENNQLLELEHNSPERSKTQSAAFLKSGGWYPVANYYYQHSFFSVYCETVSGSDNSDFPYKSITEKTWNPLIKGHFIVPFGYQGLIDHIRSYGFKLPDFIDYSYDCIEDDQERFDAYIESVEKLMSMSIYDLQKLNEEHKDILLHNRRLFWQIPYDSLYDKVVKFFNLG